MSKLVYPSDGIYIYCRDIMENYANNISRAISNCTFDIPSDFAYRNYLNGLESNLRDYYREIKQMDFKLKSTNNNYNALESDLTSSAKKMTTSKIKERDRMIV